MKHESLEAARRVTEKLLREQYKGVVFDKISVRPEIDGDGDEFLWVKVVYDGPSEDTGALTVVGLIRELRPRLEEADIKAFPVISYIAKSDLTGRSLESL